jgi:RNA polymerase sigma-70 factor, ECF subfamily
MTPAGPRRAATSLAHTALAPDEATWVARIRAGDDTAFDAMFRAYAAPLRAFARGYVSPDDAADVIQDVFVKLWHARATWEVRGSLRAYLYAAVRNHAINRVRRLRVRDRVTAAVVAELPRVMEMPADSGVNRLEQFERALARLSDKHRQVFLLRWQHDLSYAEIAAVLDVPVKTVDSRMTRALRQLRRLCLS